MSSCLIYISKLPLPNTIWPQVVCVSHPSCRCIKSLESSLKKTGSDDDDLKLVIPAQPNSPSWTNFRRRPHAYEEIMGASQEQLDWDESDMGGAPSYGGGALTSPRPDEGEAEICEMVKVDDTCREPRVRVVHHQYEDVVLGEEVKGNQALKESWVGGEGEGLPKGWQQMQDDEGREYYWHIPTGRTQYSPPALSPVKVCVASNICGTTPPLSV